MSSRHRYAKSKKSENVTISAVLGFLQNLLIALVAFTVVFSFFFRLVNVDGSSMKNTLLNSDKVVVAEMYSQPECGDIIVANCNDSIGKVVVKRVIAVEGQTLSIDYESGEVAVDGVVLDEPYISTKTDEPTNPWNVPTVIPKGYVFVMGDNRSYSLDSRDNRMQLIPISDIVGKAEFVIFPFDRIKFLY